MNFHLFDVIDYVFNIIDMNTYNMEKLTLWIYQANIWYMFKFVKISNSGNKTCMYHFCHSVLPQYHPITNSRKLFLIVWCFQVHSLFSLLGLNHAYVTNTGRLVGVVGLKEVSILTRRGRIYNKLHTLPGALNHASFLSFGHNIS